jgi:hypothetical protein
LAHAHHEARYLGTGQKSGKAVFSSRGIDLCVNYFKRRGHGIILAFVPHHRFKAGQVTNDIKHQNEFRKTIIILKANP